MDSKEQLIGTLQKLAEAFKEKSPMGADLRTLSVALQQLPEDAYNAHVDSEKLSQVLAEVSGDAGAEEVVTPVVDTPAAPEDGSLPPEGSEPFEEPSNMPVPEDNGSGIATGDSDNLDAAVTATEPEETENKSEGEDMINDVPNHKEASEIFAKYASGEAGWNRGASDVVLKGLFPAYSSVNHAPARPDAVAGADLPKEQMPTDANVHASDALAKSEGPVEGLSKSASTECTDGKVDPEVDGKAAAGKEEGSPAAEEPSFVANASFGSGFEEPQMDEKEAAEIAGLFA